MKMYFLVNCNLPVGNAINSIAHGSMMALLKWGEEKEFRSWLTDSFKKVTCEAASPEEFEESKKLGNHIVVTESALAGKETVLVFYPSEERLPFKLYRR
jgi:hypothetical protein